MSFLDAFRQADKHFTADNEPQAIRDWVDDMSFMHDDLSRWVHVAAHYLPRTLSGGFSGPAHPPQSGAAQLG
jgi:hypothetical protein